MCLRLLHHRPLRVRQPVQPVHDPVNEVVRELDLPVQLRSLLCVVEERAQCVDHPVITRIREAEVVEAVEAREGLSRHL